jgi:hypothetical protein
MKDGYMSERKLISKFLEMTTFGPRRTEIDAMAADGDWMTNGTSKRASYIRTQIDLPITSHREYWRRRTNSKVDATSQTARSDHPCSPNSKWRKYSYTPQDRFYAHDGDMYISTTFEVVKAEANLTTTIYEADSVTQVKNGTYNLGGACLTSMMMRYRMEVVVGYTLVMAKLLQRLCLKLSSRSGVIIQLTSMMMVMTT